MTEREMEDLLWDYPEKLLNEPLKQFQRQRVSAVGRADLIFEDRIGRLLVIELKRTLERGAITQLLDYYGDLKGRFPERAIELMVVASRIPPERRVACEHHDIEAREISEKRFRDVAEEVGYTFKSEVQPRVTEADEDRPPSAVSRDLPASIHADFAPAPTKVEKGWYAGKDHYGRHYFLAFVNAKGSCSMRKFDAEQGAFLRKDYQSGDFQKAFSEILTTARPLYPSRQPNLE